MSKFNTQLTAFNQLYNLPTPTTPSLAGAGFTSRLALLKRLEAFHKIVLDEIDEVFTLMVSINREATEEEILTELADWLGDLQVYCASEMTKFGLDNSKVLDIIMQSNMSKLGADGRPIYDDNGKVLKGPNYWKPEPQIQEYIRAAMGKQS